MPGRRRPVCGHDRTIIVSTPSSSSRQKIMLYLVRVGVRVSVLYLYLRCGSE